MRILGMVVLMMPLVLGVASGATIDLNDGRTVQGDIIKQDNKSLQINVDGVTMTYYADEIKDVDGKPLGTPVAQPETSAEQGTGNIAVVPNETEPSATAPVAVSASESPSVAGTIDPEKKALILKFIDVFGTRQALINNFDKMLTQIEKEKPDEAEKIRQRVKVDEIIDRLLPIYDRNFTSEDLKAFIAFYSSDDWQKLKSTIPELMKESVQESIKYMEEKFPEVKGAQ